MSESDQGGAGRREVAYRIFAAEFDDADYSYSESDEERAPNYVITPTGGRVNRLFFVGVLTEVEEVSEDVLRARVVDPTGAFVLYAGQYQPDEQAFLDGASPPTFVAVTGKARTFQPDDSDRVFTSVRPESISEVDAETRDRWTVQTAEQTLARVAQMAAALDADSRNDELRAALESSGVDEGLAAGIPLAIDHYGTTAGYLAELRALAIDAARLVADEIDEVEGLSIGPDEGTEASPAQLADPDIELATPAGQPTADAAETVTGADATTDSTDSAQSATTDSTASDSTAVESTTGESATAEAEQSTSDSPRDDTATAETTSSDTTAPSSTEPTPTDDSDSDTGADEPAASGSEETEQTTDDTSEESAESETQVATAEAGGGAISESEEGDETGESATDTSGDDEDIGDFDPGEFELDEDEREEIESEYGTEFQSGTDVPDPGEADIETPDPEEMAAETDAESADQTEGASPESTSTDETVSEPESPEGGAATESESDEPAETSEADAGDEEPAEDVALEDAAVETMGELDDGDGADHGAVVDALVEQYGASETAAEDAIQDALMDGRCYEPGDDTLKPI